MQPPAAPQIAAALYGAWRLLRFDAAGAQVFETGETAFWQSFMAALIALPGYAILVALHLSGDAPAADWASTGLLHALSYVMSWTAFPLAAYYLAAGLNAGENWVGFVIALNWSKVLQMAIYLPLVLIAETGLVGQGGGAFLAFVGFLAVLVYQWFVTKSALGIAGPAAAGLTFVDLIIGLFITTMTDAALAG
jgi:hypothetical protein